MSESVEQAALRRARFEDRTLAILERCVTAVAALDELDDRRVQEIAELRAALLALSNRIEAVTRAIGGEWQGDTLSVRAAGAS